jgi:lipoprotein NlpD
VQRPPPPPEAPVQRAPVAPPPARTDTVPGSAPVVERDTRPEVHVVRKGDTLLSISLEYGLDYRDVAAWNRLENINLIRIGQTLRLRAPGDSGTAPAGGAAAVARPAEVRPPGGLARAVPLDPEGMRTEPRALRQPFSERALADATAAGRRPGEPAAVRPEPPVATVPDPVLPPKADAAAAPAAINWAWPASGTLIERFSDTNRGIDIGGKAGQPILASADGRVVYSGSAIRGYGRMLIVKHNDQYVSVYAHASELLVKEGQAVSRGQRIAEMGSTDADRVKLHFEIRRMGRPIDPLRYLPPEGAS